MNLKLYGTYTTFAQAERVANYRDGVVEKTPAGLWQVWLVKL